MYVKGHQLIQSVTKVNEFSQWLDKDYIMSSRMFKITGLNSMH